MSTLNPPVLLEHPDNQFRVDYMQDVASQKDFDYPTVSIFTTLSQNILGLPNGILGIRPNLKGQFLVKFGTLKQDFISLLICLDIFNENFVMLSHTWVIYENNVVLHGLNISYSFYPIIDIKKNSESVQPNAPKFHFRR